MCRRTIHSHRIAIIVGVEVGMRSLSFFVAFILQDSLHPLFPFSHLQGYLSSFMLVFPRDCSSSRVLLSGTGAWLASFPSLPCSALQDSFLSQSLSVGDVEINLVEEEVRGRARHHRLLWLLEESWPTVWIHRVWSTMAPGIPARQPKGSKARAGGCFPCLHGNLHEGLPLLYRFMNRRVKFCWTSPIASWFALEYINIPYLAKKLCTSSWGCSPESKCPVSS